MFSFFNKKKPVQNALSFIKNDIHNHLLPGIDDGSPDTETSLQLLEGLTELGFENLICTPHILAELYPNTPETISKAYSYLEPVAVEKFPSLNLGFAAEYMVDFDFEKTIAPNKLLSFGKENYILIEMSYIVESPNLKIVIFNLLTNGYTPILAHPERYAFYHHRFNIYQELYDAGCSLQVNLLSLIGYYGKGIKQAAEKLIEKDLVNWVGTDMHHFNHLEALRQLATDKNALKTIGKIKNLWNQTIDMH
jgi:tyrosine-protein phosphatase YwqE